MPTIGLLLGATCAAYFAVVNSLMFSTQRFSRIFSYLLLTYDRKTAFLSIGILCVAAMWKSTRIWNDAVDAVSRRPWIYATAMVGVYAALSVLLYQSYPLSMDEYAAVFQAKAFAAGHIVSRLPANLIDWLIMPGFNGEFLIASRQTGDSVEAYWPGFAALLALFEFLHIPWGCNAVLSGIDLALIFKITMAITCDRRAAAWAMIFCSASTAFIADGISLYSMQAHLTANLLFSFLLMQPTFARALGAGVVGSIALLLHNPFPHFLYAMPWLVAFAASKDLRKFLLPLAIGYMPLAVSVGIGWSLLKHSILTVSQGLELAPLGLGGVFKIPTISMISMRIAALMKIWVWAVPALPVIAAWGFYLYRANLHARLLVLSASLMFIAYLFVDLDQGHGWGYRYIHPAWGAMPILAGFAMGRIVSASRIQVFAAASCLISALTLAPLQLWQINDFISSHLAQLPTPVRPGNNLYFVRPAAGFYLADMIQTDPLLRQTDLLLSSRGADRDRLLIDRNWQEATLVAEGSWGQQWYLGPEEHRIPENSHTSAWSIQSPTF